MENVLDVIKYAKESSLSKENQLDVIHDAYLKWLCGKRFEPSKLVEVARQRYACKDCHADMYVVSTITGTMSIPNVTEFRVWQCPLCHKTEIEYVQKEHS